MNDNESRKHQMFAARSNSLPAALRTSDPAVSSKTWLWISEQS